jgi:hypothetical protein
MFRYKLRTLLIVVAAVGAVLAFGRIAARRIVPSIGYEIRAEFTELPVNDEAFRQWVEDQPGVYQAYVNREPNAIRVVYGMSRDLTGDPPLPDFKKNFDRFGYRGLRRYHPVP